MITTMTRPAGSAAGVMWMKVRQALARSQARGLVDVEAAGVAERGQAARKANGVHCQVWMAITEISASCGSPSQL